jgi:hypothetical protein
MPDGVRSPDLPLALALMEFIGHKDVGGGEPGLARLALADAIAAFVAEVQPSIDDLEADVAALQGSLPPSRPDLLINSDGRIDNYNDGSAATTSDDSYGGPDRWYSLTQTASISVQRLTNGENGTPFYQRLTQTQASAQRMGRAQIIEGVRCRHARGQSLALSGRIRCSASQAIRYAILEWTGTEDTVTSDVVNSWTNATYTPGQFFSAATLNVLAVGAITPTANTWTDLTALVATAGGSLTNLIAVIWTEGTAAQNVTLDFRMKLEVATAATPWFPRAQTIEELLCQRFNPSWRSLSGWFATGQAASASAAGFHIPLRVVARVAPTGVVVSAAGDFSALDASGVTRAFTGVAFNNASQNALQLNGTGASNLVAGNAAAIYGNGNARIRATGCEL